MGSKQSKTDRIIQGLEKLKKQNTPLDGNKCHCGGNVVRRVRSYSHGQFHYSPPECEKCQSRYYFTKDTPTVGEEAFQKMMRTPINI